MNRAKLISIALFTLFFILFASLGGHQSFSLENLKAHHEELLGLTQQQPLLSTLTFFALYVAVTALSLPGAVPLTLLGGSLFGLIGGTLLISFASTLGATFAFLLSRFLLAEWVQKRFARAHEKIFAGFNREGSFFLFALRLNPIFPFFLVNLVMGLTSISTARYYLISQLGMLPGTIVYVNAGRELTGLNSLQDILSFEFVLSFSALGILPWVSAKALHYFRKQRDT